MATEMNRKQASHWWWLDSHSSTKRSPWLQSTISELNEKTKAILKLIEEDADSFAQRAEMYYKKRPELISMVEDFYRTHRSLAERYDQVKSETGTRLLTTFGSPFASSKYQSVKFSCFSDRSYDSYSECFDAEELVESEVDDPEQEEDKVPFVAVNDEVIKLTKFDKCRKEEEVSLMVVNDEVIRLREEMEKLREENMAQKDQLKQKDAMNDEVMRLREEVRRLREESNAQKAQLKQKDDEKIEVINHLSLAIDLLKQDSVKMRSCVAKETNNKWKNPFEISKLMGALSGKLFNGSSRNQTLVAL